MLQIIKWKNPLALVKVILIVTLKQNGYIFITYELNQLSTTSERKKKKKTET